MKEGDFQRAYEKLSRAFQEQRSFDIAANLAQVEQRLGKTRDAAEHLAFAIQMFPSMGDQAPKERMKTDLATLEAQVGTLEIQAPEGTTIRVADRVVGVTPLVPIYIDPGRVSVAADHPKLGKADQTLTVPKGQRTTARTNTPQ